MNKVALKKEVEELIDSSRRTGNTTSMVDCALRHNAYLIVRDDRTANHLRKEYPKLQVFGLGDLRELKGRYRCPIIFDPDVVSILVQPDETHEKLQKANELLAKIKSFINWELKDIR